MSARKYVRVLLGLLDKEERQNDALKAEIDHLRYLIDRTRDDLNEATASREFAYVENAERRFARSAYLRGLAPAPSSEAACYGGWHEQNGPGTGCPSCGQHWSTPSKKRDGKWCSAADAKPRSEEGRR